MLIFGMNPNINFLLNGPCVNSPPNMVPAGSLNIPRYEDTPAGRAYEERRDRFKPLEIPEYKPVKFEMPKYEPPKFELPKHEPTRMDVFPKKNFLDKI